MSIPASVINRRRRVESGTAATFRSTAQRDVDESPEEHEEEAEDEAAHLGLKESTGFSGTGWILLIVVGVVLWLAAHGRLANTVFAMQLPGTPTAPPGGGGSGGGSSGGGSSASVPSSFPSPSLFGLSGVTHYVDPSSFYAADSQETSAYGGATVHEYDYLLRPGTMEPFSLPVGNYTVLDNRPSAQTGGVGGIFTVRTSTGGILSFLHLTKNPSAAVGSTIKGGPTGGVSGWPMAAQYGVGGSYGPNNALLGVAVDAKGAQYLGGS